MKARRAVPGRDNHGSDGGQGAGRRRRDAFSLIELLVVIAIVALVAAMALPVLAGAKGRAQSVQCLGNLRQLQVAWQLYADDHDGRLAPNWYFEAVETNPGRFQSWARGVMSFEANRPDNTLLRFTS